jgi:short-subunit dehydrogenase
MAYTCFTGKSVWITGASSGLGCALALELAAQGARLILSGRNQDALNTVAAAAGSEARVLAFDLEDSAAREAASKQALSAFGSLDFLILNAGISQRSLFMDTSQKVFLKIMETNFISSVDITRVVLPAMVQRGTGSILCISSLAGLMGVPLRSSYSASKHALAGFYASLRAEIEGSGVKIHIAYPGFVKTMISHNALQGDGSPHGVLDPLQEKGKTPVSTAQKILKSVAAGKLDIRVAMDAKARLALFLSRRAPSLAAKALFSQKGL